MVACKKDRLIRYRPCEMFVCEMAVYEIAVCERPVCKT
jgi:hypothetical protein